MPKLKYPAYFGGGLKGIECTEDIEHREGFIYVPYKLVVSYRKILNHPVLKPVLEEAKKYIIKYKHTLQWDAWCLTLFLFYETTLLSKSYWYPWL